MHRQRRAILFLLLPLAASCADDEAAPTMVERAPRAAVAPLPGASVSVPVRVPARMRTAPFDVERRLNVPPGFAIEVYARIPGVRFLHVLPDNNILASIPSAGKVVLIRPGANGADATVTDWATGLRNPHDIVTTILGRTLNVYVAESHQIIRFPYSLPEGVQGPKTVVVANLPDNSSPELRGRYGHQLKNIAIRDNNLFVSIASPSNADPADVTRTPKGAAIYVYDINGGNGRLYAQGLRNAEGLALPIGPNADLWVVVNNRDNVAYPFHNDWDGDGSDDYGKVIPSYVDNHPPEAFTRVRDGGNYGWPFCNPNPDTPSGLDDMPFDRDVQNNADGSRLDCAQADRVTRGIQAHSAPLGLTFLEGTIFPEPYRQGAVVAYHGSWNRSAPTGYKVVVFPWDAAAVRPGPESDLVTGWTVGGVWGRPVDMAVDWNGGMLISDDHSGTVYRLYATQRPQTHIVLQNVNTGLRVAWEMNRTAFQRSVDVSTEPTEWSIAASGDFTGDGVPDLLWQRRATGDQVIWRMDGFRWTGEQTPLMQVHPDWRVVGAGDFTGDGRPDIVWQNRREGRQVIWHMTGTAWNGSQNELPRVEPNWWIVGVGDFSGDGRPDLVWQDRAQGRQVIWHMTGTTWGGAQNELQRVVPGWEIVGAGDFTGDARPDLLWQRPATGSQVIWKMDGTTWNGEQTELMQVPTEWRVATPLAGPRTSSAFTAAASRAAASGPRFTTGRPSATMRAGH